jgi:hypothetical protein
MYTKKQVVVRAKIEKLAYKEKKAKSISIVAARGMKAA